jgi:hypothetical protein
MFAVLLGGIVGWFAGCGVVLAFCAIARRSDATLDRIRASMRAGRAGGAEGAAPTDLHAANR